MKETVTPKFVKPKEAAAYLGLNYRTFRHAVKKGVIPFYKLGTLTLFKPEELDQAISANRVASVSEVLA